MSWPFIRTLIDRGEVSSTSDLARELIRAGGVALPMAVRARRQTRGRGRGANSWWSDEGSLTVTLALDPGALGLKPGHEPRLALATAVALIDAVSPSVAPAVFLGIRWPNDVEASAKKLAGVLPERVETADGPRLLIGVGVNVRTRLDDAPAAVRRMAVSLHELTTTPGVAPDVDDVFRGLLERLPAVLDQLARDDPALAERWADLDTLRGHPVRVDLGTRVVSGVGSGIDPEGALCLATERETLRLFGGQVLRDPRPSSWSFVPDLPTPS
jgi:BirA family biotin operon repressor/biotin-[acetyl-CoA-carboxylase] ligase